MRYRMLGGKRTAVLALGSTDFGGLIPEARCREIMDAYVEIGGNFIDTARVYGDFTGGPLGESERVIGRWLEARGRDKFFLSTKGGHPRFDSMTTGRLSPGEIRDDMRRSLDNLRTDRVDIYWLHRDDVARPVGEILETLNGLVEDGMTGMIGVSNWTTARILEAQAWAADHGLRPLDANQPQCSLARQMVVEDPTLVSMDGEMWRMHADTGLTMIPFSSQAKGFFTKLFELGAENLPDKAKRRFYYPENLAVYDRVLKLREETGLSVGAIALAWLTSQPFPTFPLCGASRPEQALALAEAGDAELTPAQRDYLKSWDRG